MMGTTMRTYVWALAIALIALTLTTVVDAAPGRAQGTRPTLAPTQLPLATVQAQLTASAIPPTVTRAPTATTAPTVVPTVAPPTATPVPAQMPESGGADDLRVIWLALAAAMMLGGMALMRTLRPRT
jgi:hypothetical protein